MRGFATIPDDALFIGLMSGTSIDSVDAVLARFQANKPETVSALAVPIEAGLRQRILCLMQSGDDEINQLGLLDNAIARLFATATQNLLAQAKLSAKDIYAIGSHGQTVRHAPDALDPYTVQIGNPSLLAELTGISVVADFRRRDMAAKGQGAPLAPAFHAAFFSDPTQHNLLVNIGGIANISLLHQDGTVSGFDTGPGNALLDAWVKQHLNQTQDTDADWAKSGTVHQPLLARLLDDDYFAKPAPKSTGKEYFNLAWLQSKLATIADHISPADVQATLTELTGMTIAQSLREFLASNQATHADVIACGGGVHNPLLMVSLRRELPNVALLTSDERGISSDYMEALGFAWLARQTLQGLPGNIPAVTGALGERVLGAIYPA